MPRELIEYVNILLATGWRRVNVWKKGAVYKETAQEAYKHEKEITNGKTFTSHTEHYD